MNLQHRQQRPHLLQILHPIQELLLSVVFQLQIHLNMILEIPIYHLHRMNFNYSLQGNRRLRHLQSLHSIMMLKHMITLVLCLFHPYYLHQRFQVKMPIY